MADRLARSAGRHYATVLQLLGLIVLVIAGFTIHPILGLVLTGVFLFGFGYLIEKPVKVSANVPKHSADRG